MLVATQSGMLPLSRLRDKSTRVRLVTVAMSQLSVPASPRPASDSAVGTLFVVHVTPLQDALHSGPDQLASCVPVGPRSASRNASSAAAPLAADAGSGLGGGGGGLDCESESSGSARTSTVTSQATTRLRAPPTSLMTTGARASSGAQRSSASGKCWEGVRKRLWRRHRCSRISA